MNAFYYSPADIGLAEFAPGYFQLGARFPATDDPSRADCFVLPTDIRHVTDAQLRALPYLHGNERRHVFFSLSEFPKRALPFDALAFRTDMNCNLRSVNPSTRVWCWGVDDLKEYVPLPEGGFRYDVHAQLWASTPFTDAAVESCQQAGLNVHDQRNPFFYGTLETAKDERLAELRKTFLESMQASRFVLVPRSRPGINRYRFFEAMSCGRVPVLLCDECELPLADRINYDLFTVRIAEKDVSKCGERLRQILNRFSDGGLVDMGERARAAWVNWLAPAVWEARWGQLTQEHLEGLGYVSR